MDYLYILREALVWTITIFWLYQIVVSLCSLVKIKDKPLKVNKNHKFMAIIPAHNEEAVVANLVDSLKKQNYDKDLYDIYVIADNCTDNTAKVAKEAGAIVRHEYLQGKGNVIRRMFRDIDARCYLMIDGDDTYPAEAAPEMIRSSFLQDAAS